jgi:hypothetical protein
MNVMVTTDWNGWVVRWLQTEIFVLLVVVLGMLVLFATPNRELVRVRTSNIVAIALAIGCVLLKFLYMNTGTLISMTQEFANDQLAVVSLGFAVHAARRNRTGGRIAKTVIVACSAGITVFALLWWIFLLLDVPVLSCLFAARNRFADSIGLF